MKKSAKAVKKTTEKKTTKKTSLSDAKKSAKKITKKAAKTAKKVAKVVGKTLDEATTAKTVETAGATKTTKTTKSAKTAKSTKSTKPAKATKSGKDKTAVKTSAKKLNEEVHARQAAKKIEIKEPTPIAPIAEALAKKEPKKVEIKEAPEESAKPAEKPEEKPKPKPAPRPALKPVKKTTSLAGPLDQSTGAEKSTEPKPTLSEPPKKLTIKVAEGVELASGSKIELPKSVTAKIAKSEAAHKSEESHDREAEQKAKASKSTSQKTEAPKPTEPKPTRKAAEKPKRRGPRKVNLFLAFLIKLALIVAVSASSIFAIYNFLHFAKVANDKYVLIMAGLHIFTLMIIVFIKRTRLRLAFVFLATIALLVASYLRPAYVGTMCPDYIEEGIDPATVCESGINKNLYGLDIEKTNKQGEPNGENFESVIEPTDEPTVKE